MRGATVQQCQVCGENRSTNPHGARGGDSGCYQKVTARARTMDDVKEVIYTTRRTQNTFGTVALAQHHILRRTRTVANREGQAAKGFVSDENETARHIRSPSAPPASITHKNTHAFHHSQPLLVRVLTQPEQRSWSHPIAIDTSY